MKLLIHACCADCLLKYINSIREKNKKISEIEVYFYNPNIHPRAEYLARLKAIQKITEENKIKLIVADWSPREWFETLRTSGTSLDPSKADAFSRAGERETLKQQNPPVSTEVETFSLKKGGSQKIKSRCEGCWNLRLNKTFEYAKNKKFDLVSSTLITSHYQNSKKIKEIAKDLENEYKIKFLIPKKVSKDLKTSGFYKQNYCGCCYSLVEAWEEKFSIKR